MTIEGGEDLSRAFDKGLDYIQNSFNTSEGVINRNQPTLLYRGIVIEIDFTTIKPTTTAALVPPFSIYAKIIGLDESSENPLSDYDRVYYPPLFPMHNLCIPEVGEEILIMKESPEATSMGYYIGRVNDSTPLNIDYAREFVGINDPLTENMFRYGFSFDVRELRREASLIDPTSMPSDTYQNVSIPVTYGDVVQQGRSKTYTRHSFNRNNKEGVLEQGIQLSGQGVGESGRFDFSYNGAGVNFSTNPTTIEQTIKDESGEPRVVTKIGNENYFLPPNEVMKQSYDPSIGETSTKTIHFIDTSIRRLGDYSLQSDVGPAGQSDIEGYNKSMIVNMADEIYNISSKEIGNSLYRHVLGEKLVTQQKEIYTLMGDVLNVVSDFAQTTQVLLDAFLDHEHALPEISLDLEEEVTFQDTYRTEPVYAEARNHQITVRGVPDSFAMLPDYGGVTFDDQGSFNEAPGFTEPGSEDLQVLQAAQNAIAKQDMSLLMDVAPPLNGDPNFQDFFKAADVAEKYPLINLPGTRDQTFSIPMPPRLVTPSTIETEPRKQSINFEAIIGGEDNPRFTARVATATAEGEGVALGVKTGKVHTNLQETVNKIAQQQVTIIRLSQKITDFLSKNQFVN